jgi:hypothetical protein
MDVVVGLGPRELDDPEHFEDAELFRERSILR